MGMFEQVKPMASESRVLFVSTSTNNDLAWKRGRLWGRELRRTFALTSELDIILELGRGGCLRRLDQECFDRYSRIVWTLGWLLEAVNPVSPRYGLRN